MKKLFLSLVLFLLFIPSSCFAIMPTKDLEYVGSLSMPCNREYIAMNTVTFINLPDGTPSMVFETYTHYLKTNLMVMRLYEILPLDMKYRVIGFKSVDVNAGEVGESRSMYDNEYNNITAGTIPEIYMNYIFNNYERYAKEGYIYNN